MEAGFAPPDARPGRDANRHSQKVAQRFLECREHRAKPWTILSATSPSRDVAIAGRGMAGRGIAGRDMAR